MQITIDSSTKGFKILQKDYNMIPEGEMPLTINVNGEGFSFTVSFCSEEDKTKDRNIVEDRVEEGKLRFTLTNWDLGYRANLQEPTLFAEIEGRNIYIYVSMERTLTNMYCIYIMLMEKNDV